MIQVHQLCSLEANYCKSQGRAKLSGCQTPKPEFFGVLDTHCGCATAHHPQKWIISGKLKIQG